MPDLEPIMNLDTAITQQINLGQRDPIEIAKKIEDLYGQDWVKNELLQYSEDFIASMARSRLGAIRNNALHQMTNQRKQRSARVGEANFLGSTKWVYGIGYKKVSDLTVEDCQLIVSHYEMIKRAAETFSEFYSTLISRMLATGAVNLGELAKIEELPTLEEEEPPHQLTT